MSVQVHDDTEEPDELQREDHFVYLDGIRWDVYEALLEARGEHSVPRMTYLDGMLELMSPGQPHESAKKSIARVLERWADERKVFFEGVGSWTVRKKKKKGGAEADECYFVDKRQHKRWKRPDIAIEVVFSSRGLDKLEVWRRLAVPEVWIWDGPSARLQFHVEDEGEYRLAERSRFLPDLEPELIVECMAEPTQGQAITRLLARIRPA